MISTAQQLPLIIHQLSTGYPQESGETLKSRKNSDFSPTTTTILTDIKNKEIKEKEVVLININETRKNSDFPENKKLLRSYGVGEPMLSRLSEMEWVNPKYIKILRHMTGVNTALLIHRIRSHDPIPTERYIHWRNDKILFIDEDWK